MKRLFSGVMSLFLILFIAFSFFSAEALAQNTNSFSNLDEKPTLESIENHLQ